MSPTTEVITGRSAPTRLTAAATTTPITPAMPARAAARPGFACTHWLIASTTCWTYGATVWIAETSTPPITGATAESAAMSDSTTGPSASIAAPSTGPRTEARVPAKEATEPKADASAGIDGRSATTPARTPSKNDTMPPWRAGVWKASEIAVSATEPICPARVMT